eukprot:10914719-Alexandrium_andersonii.AAC.1
MANRGCASSAPEAAHAQPQYPRHAACIQPQVRTDTHRSSRTGPASHAQQTAPHPNVPPYQRAEPP